jgi:hypothetical protein
MNSDVIVLPAGDLPLPTASVVAVARTLQELTPASADDENTLLGNRFLCRRGGLLFVGSAGIGKSTAVMQMGMSWAAGRSCFGIKPRKPLKIIYFNGENDEGDLCEMRDGILAGLELNEKELSMLVERNFLCVDEASRTGAELITSLVRPLVKEHAPDLIIIDPALSFIRGSISEQQVMTEFLRDQLRPLLVEFNCGAMIVHHTNKPPTDRQAVKKLASDYAYSGSGSAEWANFMRAVLVLEPRNEDGIRVLRIGKRPRLSWVDEDGKPTMTKWLKQAAPGSGLFYKELTPQEAILARPKADPVFKALYHPAVLPSAQDWISKKALVARLIESGICGRDKARDHVIPSLIDQGYLREEQKRRNNARPEVGFVRTDQRPGHVKVAFGRVDNNANGSS